MGLSRKARRRLAVIEEKLDSTIANRPCDGCTACCTVLGVEELDKPLGVSCRHVVIGGCGIYADRPKSCRDFICCWRAGFGEIDDRPDKSGVVFDFVRKHALEGKAVLAREVWPGAFETAAPLLHHVAQRMMVFLMVGDRPRRLLGPEDQILAHREIIAQIVGDSR